MQHTATIAHAEQPWRVYFGDTLLLETGRVLELTERYGARQFAAVPYFAEDAVAHLDLRPSDGASTCPLKGAAEYFSVHGVSDAAWRYPDPHRPVASIARHVAFDTTKGFRVERAR